MHLRCASLALLAATLMICVGCRDTIDHHAEVEQRFAASDAAERRAAVEELKIMGALSAEQLALVEQAMRDDDALVRREATRLFIVQCAEQPDGRERFASLANDTQDQACREMLAAAATGRLVASDAQE